MSFEKTFSKLKTAVQKSNLEEFDGNFAFQFNIIGEGEGTFYVAKKNGRVSCEPYDYVDRTALITGQAETLSALLSGKMPEDKIVDGKFIKIQGNVPKAVKILRFIKAPTIKVTKIKSAIEDFWSDYNSERDIARHF